MRKLSSSEAVIAVLCPVAGYLGLHIPWRLAVQSGTTYARNMVDGLQPVSVLLLAILGLIAAGASPRRWWLWPLLLVALLPLATLAGVIRDPTSHNLWPFEIVLYAFLSIPAYLGAFLSYAVRKWLLKAKR